MLILHHFRILLDLVKGYLAALNTHASWFLELRKNSLETPRLSLGVTGKMSLKNMEQKIPVKLSFESIFYGSSGRTRTSDKVVKGTNRHEFD